MAAVNPDPNPIDAFLEGLGLGVEKPPQKQVPQSVLVRVVYEQSQEPYTYIVHCFVYNPAEIPKQLTETSLEGRLMRGQTMFNVESLRRFSEIIEAIFEQKKVEFYRSLPLLPSHSDNLISYELVPRSGAPMQTYITARSSIFALYETTEGNLVGRSP